MRRLPRGLRLFLPMVAIAVAGSTTGIALGGNPEQHAPPIDRGTVVPISGIGETLVIVIGGDYGSRAEAEAATAAAQRSFGHLQGFYIDESDNYEVLGIYEQTSADLRVIPCPEWRRETRMECPRGLSEVKAYQTVNLRHVSRADIRPFLAAREEVGCGTPGFRPCARANLAGRLTPAFSLRPGRFLTLTAFRTKLGAEEFIDFARAAGVADLAVLRVHKLGGGFVGLGQESHPDGSGPLEEPLADPAPYQE